MKMLALYFGTDDVTFICLLTDHSGLGGVSDTCDPVAAK
jgi:hypothetical protein